MEPDQHTSVLIHSPASSPPTFAGSSSLTVGSRTRGKERHSGHKGHGARKQKPAQVTALFFLQGPGTLLLDFSMTSCAVSHPYFYFSTCLNLDFYRRTGRIHLATSRKPTWKGAVQ